MSVGVNPPLHVMRAAAEDLGSVAGIAATVPGEKGTSGVIGHGVEFFAQDFAADDEALFRLAERGEERGIEARFALDLPHHLH